MRLLGGGILALLGIGGIVYGVMLDRSGIEGGPLYIGVSAVVATFGVGMLLGLHGGDDSR